MDEAGSQDSVVESTKEDHNSKKMHISPKSSQQQDHEDDNSHNTDQETSDHSDVEDSETATENKEYVTMDRVQMDVDDSFNKLNVTNESDSERPANPPPSPLVKAEKSSSQSSQINHLKWKINQASLYKGVKTKKGAKERIMEKMKGVKQQKESVKRTTSSELIEEGTWVQCGLHHCQKWRHLADIHDPSLIPEFWMCSMNADASYNSCSTPEISYSASQHERDFIYTQFTEGSVVWAKMAGYPRWPAMIESDPDTQCYAWTTLHNKMDVSHYHVVFLDTTVSRAWVSLSEIEPYFADETTTFTVSMITVYSCSIVSKSGKGKSFKAQVMAARQAADAALQLSIKERLAKYGFSVRYTGKVREADIFKYKTDKPKKPKKQRKPPPIQEKTKKKKTTIREDIKDEDKMPGLEKSFSCRDVHLRRQSQKLAKQRLYDFHQDSDASSDEDSVDDPNDLAIAMATAEEVLEDVDTVLQAMMSGDEEEDKKKKKGKKTTKKNDNKDQDSTYDMDGMESALEKCLEDRVKNDEKIKKKAAKKERKKLDADGNERKRKPKNEKSADNKDKTKKDLNTEEKKPKKAKKDGGKKVEKGNTFAPVFKSKKASPSDKIDKSKTIEQKDVKTDVKTDGVETAVEVNTKQNDDGKLAESVNGDMKDNDGVVKESNMEKEPDQNESCVHNDENSFVESARKALEDVYGKEGNTQEQNTQQNNTTEGVKADISDKKAVETDDKIPDSKEEKSDNKKRKKERKEKRKNENGEPKLKKSKKVKGDKNGDKLDTDGVNMDGDGKKKKSKKIKDKSNDKNINEDTNMVDKEANDAGISEVKANKADKPKKESKKKKKGIPVDGTSVPSQVESTQKKKSKKFSAPVVSKVADKAAENGKNEKISDQKKDKTETRTDEKCTENTDKIDTDISDNQKYDENEIKEVKAMKKMKLVKRKSENNTESTEIKKSKIEEIINSLSRDIENDDQHRNEDQVNNIDDVNMKQEIGQCDLNLDNKTNQTNDIDLDLTFLPGNKQNYPDFDQPKNQDDIDFDLVPEKKPDLEKPDLDFNDDLQLDLTFDVQSSQKVDERSQDSQPFELQEE